MKYITKIEQLEQLSDSEKAQLKSVTDKFDFRCNEYYLSLINWDDPDDPLRRLIIPDLCELEEWGRLDPSDEKSFSVMPGVEHKYNSTVLMLISNVCEGICRYCFRKRIFIDHRDDSVCDIQAAVEYIKQRSEVTNVLLTGGDPFILKPSRLEEILRELATIEHVRIIRFGTKVPAFNPSRIIEEPALPELINRYGNENKKIYIMTHFVHPREITDLAVKAVNILHKAGAIIANQMPLIKGINSDPEILGDLLAQLSFVGVVPYYIFQCRPAIGNKAYTVPIEEGYEIIEQAKALVSGLAKRVRFVMSHSTGKIEIVGKTEENVYLKYHRAADDQESGRFMVFASNPEAYWFDDYAEISADYPISLPYRIYGPE